MVDGILPLLEARSAHEVSQTGHTARENCPSRKAVTVTTKGEPS
jgi:hypothetical protein